MFLVKQSIYVKTTTYPENSCQVHTEAGRTEPESQHLAEEPASFFLILIQPRLRLLLNQSETFSQFPCALCSVSYIIIKEKLLLVILKKLSSLKA